MNALEFLADLCGRGVVFSYDQDVVRVNARGCAVTLDERGLLRTLRPQIRGLLMQRLPDRAAEDACDRFAAAPGAALCEHCAHGIGAHFWRRYDECRFFVGAGRETACRRCGEPRTAHVTGPRNGDAA